jgi:hypothetical protein
VSTTSYRPATAPIRKLITAAVAAGYTEQRIHTQTITLERPGSVSYSIFLTDAIDQNDHLARFYGAQASNGNTYRTLAQLRREMAL